MEESYQEDEVMGVALRGRRPRQDSHTATTTTTISTTTATTGIHNIGGDSSANMGSAQSSFNQKQNGKLENGIFVDSDNKDANVDIAMPKAAESSAATSILPISIMTVGEHILPRVSSRTTENGISVVDKYGCLAPTEVYLDNVYEKPAAHEFYCPNCNSCIKKVFLREAESESRPAPQRPHPVDPLECTFRCTSCFSFLIPIGSWFFPNLVPKEEGAPDKQEQVPPHDSSKNKAPSIDENKAPSIDENIKPPPFSGGIEDEDSEAKKAPSHVGPGRENDSNNIVPYQKPKQDTKPQIEVIIDGGRRGPELVVPDITPIIGDVIDRTPGSESRGVEILKSIVYGGLVESITSLSILTSAASADATTLNIIALSLANLVGGLFIIGHNLWDLKVEQPRGASTDRYQELLGQKKNFALHLTIALLSFIIFGLVPPVVYGFTFMENEDRNLKLAAVSGASLLCITILAIGKAYINKKNYIKTVLYYLVTGFAASGISYVVGDLIKNLIEKSGWFKSGEAVTVPLAGMRSGIPAWASY